MLSLTLNGSPVQAAVRPYDRLIDVLRGPLAALGTKEGCGEGECGACTVLVDGRAVNSCLYSALEAEGRDVRTIEDRETMAVLQRAFVEKGGIQCGFCTPGMIVAASALLAATPDPSDEQIALALLGNLCRCTGYRQIFDSVRHAARLFREGRNG